MADRSYPRSGRLTKPFQFERVLRAPEVSAAAGPLRLRATPNRICSARLGVVVAKRVLRRAVDRNRTKRQIREVFRLLRAELPALDIVIRLVPSSSNRNSLDVASIRQAANELLGSLGK